MIYKQLLLALAPVAAVNTAADTAAATKSTNNLPAESSLNFLQLIMMQQISTNLIPMKLSANTLLHHHHHHHAQQQQAMMAMGRRSVAVLPLFFWMRFFSSESRLNRAWALNASILRFLMGWMKEHSTEDEVVALEWVCMVGYKYMLPNLIRMQDRALIYKKPEIVDGAAVV